MAVSYLIPALLKICGADQIYRVQPISRTSLISILKRAYSVPCTASNSEISALLAIFSLAASNNPGPWISSEQFYELSMEALQLNDVLAETDLSTIEAMTLQSAYLYLASDSDNIRRSWNYVGIAIRMAYGVSNFFHDVSMLLKPVSDGTTWVVTQHAFLLLSELPLDRDPKLIGLSDEECTRRRRMFHELITLDAWQVRF